MCWQYYSGDLNTRSYSSLQYSIFSPNGGKVIVEIVHTKAFFFFPMSLRCRDSGIIVVARLINFRILMSFLVVSLNDRCFLELTFVSGAD